MQIPARIIGIREFVWRKKLAHFFARLQNSDLFHFKREQLPSENFFPEYEVGHVDHLFDKVFNQLAVDPLDLFDPIDVDHNLHRTSQTVLLPIRIVGKAGGFKKIICSVVVLDVIGNWKKRGNAINQ